MAYFFRINRKNTLNFHQFKDKINYCFNQSVFVSKNMVLTCGSLKFSFTLNIVIKKRVQGPIAVDLLN